MSECATAWTRRASLAAARLLLLVLLCASSSPALGQNATPTIGGAVILATTTSTADAGLLDALAPHFQQATGYTLKPFVLSFVLLGLTYLVTMTLTLLQRQYLHHHAPR